jgi:hypothetical protein
MSAHARAQVIYYMAENMIQRRDEIAHRLAAVGEEQAAAEIDLSIERIFTYAAWADKYDGMVHHPPGRNIAIAMPEPVGVIGILAPTRGAAARSALACAARHRRGQLRWLLFPRKIIRSSSAICTRCSTPAICLAASSTSLPASRRNWARRWPSMTVSKRSGASGAMRKQRWCGRFHWQHEADLDQRRPLEYDWFNPAQASQKAAGSCSHSRHAGR